ncbi:MAG: RNA methyltransferase [Eubacterium sp.]|nr:RNA methyltransferase [Eubacterium sp.]MDE6155354.1 RNA methyltransferase [Eubacterium sp.]
MEKITGKNNDLIKNVKKLLSSSKERRVQGLFVLEGARLVFDVLNSFYKIKNFLITPAAYEKYREQADELIELSQCAHFISEDVAEKLSDTKSSQGVFAVCTVDCSNELINKDNAKLIALDNVQDPGNLGTIVRTAEALGLDGVIVGGGCDIYNPKVLRASMGSMLRINIAQTDNLADSLKGLKQKGLTIYGTSPDSNAKNITELDFSNGGVCIIGNEANGISDEIKNICDMLITIPMLGRAESLNAAVAASITMWEMLR